MALGRVRNVLSLFTIVGLLLGSWGVSQAATNSFRIVTQNVYISHIAAGAAVEPFVFVETTPGASTVRRAAKTDSPLSPLFGVGQSGAAALGASEITDAVSTFPKGLDLGVALGDWMKAKGDFTLTCKFRGDKVTATLDSDFTGLVSRGTYSLWGIHGFNLDRSFLNFTDLVALETNMRASSSGRASERVSLTFCPTAFNDPTELKVLMLYQMNGKLDSRQPLPRPFGISVAPQLFRVIR